MVLESIDDADDAEWEDLKKAWITNILIIAHIIIFIIIIINYELIQSWELSNSDIFVSGEYSKLFTFFFIHQNIFKLIPVLIVFMAFGTSMEKKYPRWQYLPIYFGFGGISGIILISLSPEYTFWGTTFHYSALAGMLFVHNMKKSRRNFLFLLFLAILPLYEFFLEPALYFGDLLLIYLLLHLIMFFIGIIFGLFFYFFNTHIIKWEPKA